MKNDIKLKAKELFFQTDLNKSQIANILNISRSSLHFWVRTENWERLKLSAEHLPPILAENLYHILGKLTEHHLSERRRLDPITPKEVDSIHKLIRSIDKLKTRSTLNENQETFALFLDKLKKSKPEMAEAIAPEINEFLSYRAAIGRHTLMPDTFNSLGCFEEKEINQEEIQIDKKEYFEEQLKNEIQNQETQFNNNQFDEEQITQETNNQKTQFDTQEYSEPQTQSEVQNQEIELANQENPEPQIINENDQQEIDMKKQIESEIQTQALIKQIRDSANPKPENEKKQQSTNKKTHWTKLYPPIPDSQPLTSIYQ